MCWSRSNILPLYFVSLWCSVATAALYVHGGDGLQVTATLYNRETIVRVHTRDVFEGSNFLKHRGLLVTWRPFRAAVESGVSTLCAPQVKLILVWKCVRRIQSCLLAECWEPAADPPTCRSSQAVNKSLFLFFSNKVWPPPPIPRERNLARYNRTEGIPCCCSCCRSFGSIFEDIFFVWHQSNISTFNNSKSVYILDLHHKSLKTNLCCSVISKRQVDGQAATENGSKSSEESSRSVVVLKSGDDL